MKIGKYTIFAKTPAKKMEPSMNFAIEPARIEMPEIVEEKNKEYVSFGKKNLYPKELIKLTETSALHNAIISSKSTMMAGKSILVNGLSFDEYAKTISLDQAIKLKVQLRQFEAMRHKLAIDYQHFGAYAFEIIYSPDFKRMVQVNHVNVSDVRSGKYIDGKIEKYYYSRNWEDLRKHPYEEIAAYDPKNRTDYRQLVYRYTYSPDQEYYGKPSYRSALSWIKLDSEIGLFHLSNIENGFFPGLHISYFKEPASLDERAKIVDLQNKQFKGAGKAGRTVTSFSDGKENAVEIKPLAVPDLDKQFTIIGETVIQQIISAHKVTSPMLLGIATSGKLGYSNELETAQRIFESQVISPDRNLEESDFQMIANYNGFNEIIELEQFNPLAGDTKAATTNTTLAALNSLSPLVANKVLESMTETEIRNLVDLDESTEPIKPPVV